MMSAKAGQSVSVLETDRGALQQGDVFGHRSLAVVISAPRVKNAQCWVWPSLT